jgi:hypothetical protein
MINKFVSFAIVAVFVLCMASIALARGAPEKQKAFTAQAIVSVHVAPTVANVPPMTTGFDVILNISPAFPRLANVNQYTDTSERGSRSTTGDERKSTSASTCLARSGPNSSTILRA